MMRRPLSALPRHRGGSVAVEFIMLIPVLTVLLLAAVDLGNIIYSRFRLTSAVAAGAAMVTNRASDVGTSSATALAQSVATLVANANGNGWAAARIIVNNGPIGTKTGTAAASATTTTTATTNGLCYCPTSNAGFGTSQNCGTSCTGGGIAGRWVRISARRAFEPVFSDYGMVPSDGYITVVSMVQTE